MAGFRYVYVKELPAQFADMPGHDGDPALHTQGSDAGPSGKRPDTRVAPLAAIRS